MKIFGNDFWKRNTSYVSSDRYKSAIFHEGALYICTQSHTSGDAFADNEDKFSLVGAASEGGSGSLIPQGEWDVEASTVEGQIETTDPILSVPYASSIDDNEVTINSTNYVIEDNFYLYGAATTNGIVNDFTTTKWLTIENSGLDNNFDIWALYDATGIADPILDIVLATITGDPINTPFLSGQISHYFGTTDIDVKFGNGDGNLDSAGIPNNIFNSSPFEAFSFGINTTLGKIYVDDTITVREYDIPVGLFDNVSNLTLVVGGVTGGFVDNTKITISFPSNPPEGSALQETHSVIEVAPPQGAADGTMWKVTTEGTFDGEILQPDDFVIFYDDLSKVVVIPDVTSELIAINNEIEDLQAVSIDIFQKALIRSVIDYVSSTTPSEPIEGQVWLPIVGADRTYFNNLWIFHDDDWVEWETIPSHQIFKYADFGIELKYLNNFSFIQSYTRTLTQDYVDSFGSVLNPLKTLIDEIGNTNSHWIVYNAEIAPVLQLTSSDVAEIGSTINFNNYGGAVKNIVEFSDNNDSYIALPHDDDQQALFDIITKEYVFVNNTGVDVLLKFGDFTNGLPVNLITSSFVIETANSLSLEVRTAYSSNFPNVNVMLSYKAGQYKKTAYATTSTSGTIETYNVTDFIITVDDDTPLDIKIHGSDISSDSGFKHGQVFKVYYNATAGNSDINIKLGSIADFTSPSAQTTLTVNGGDKGIFTIIFNKDTNSLEVF